MEEIKKKIDIILEYIRKKSWVKQR
jgi:hypothetical protein